MPENFGVFAKLREIIRVSSKEEFADQISLARRLFASAERPNSKSPFKRRVADDNTGAEFIVLELGTISNHIRFAEKIGLVAYVSSDSPFLPGIVETETVEFSQELIDDRVRAFLSGKGILVDDLEAALAKADFKDIESLTEILRDARGTLMSEADLRKCVRLLGDCGISLKYSRKKTYAAVRRTR